MISSTLLTCCLIQLAFKGFINYKHLLRITFCLSVYLNLFYRQITSERLLFIHTYLELNVISSYELNSFLYNCELELDLLSLFSLLLNILSQLQSSLILLSLDYIVLKAAVSLLVNFDDSKQNYLSDCWFIKFVFSFEDVNSPCSFIFSKP